MNCLLLSCYSCRFHLTDAIFSAAYIKALEDSIAVLDKIAMSIDINDRKSILSLYLLIWSQVTTTLVSDVGLLRLY